MSRTAYTSGVGLHHDQTAGDGGGRCARRATVQLWAVEVAVAVTLTVPEVPQVSRRQRWVHRLCMDYGSNKAESESESVSAQSSLYLFK